MFSLLGNQKLWCDLGRQGYHLTTKVYPVSGVINRKDIKRWPQYQQMCQQKVLVNSEDLQNSKEPPVVMVPLNLNEAILSSVLKEAPVATVGTNLVTQNVKNERKAVTEEFPWQITPNTDLSNLKKHYLMLSKSRLTMLVVITSMAGYAMAPAPFDLTTFTLCSIGTGLCSAAANSINQYHEVPFDAQMSRTKNRVLVRGLISPLHAIGFAFGSASLGFSTLYFGVNELTAILGAGNLFLYSYIYTPMKRYSIVNTWVGSIVGAIPPLMGWAACAGHLDPGAWIFAGLLYAWQFPHFNALSWNLRPDYSRAGYRMMAVTNPDLCRKTTLRYTAGIIGLTSAAPLLDVTNYWFVLETMPLNVYFLYLAWQFYKNSDSKTSRKLFRFSLLHLPLLMVLFLLNKKRWFFTESTDINMAITNSEELLKSTDNSSDSFNEPLFNSDHLKSPVKVSNPSSVLSELTNPVSVKQTL